MARLTRRVAATSTAIVAVLALAACGGGTSTKDKNAYARKVNAAQQRFASTVSTVDQASGSKSSIAVQQRTLQRFKRAIDGVVGDLRRIDAPGEVAKEHDRLVAVMQGFDNDIGQASDALRNPTTTAIAQAKQRVGLATRSVNGKVNAAISAINVKLKGK
ncbi:MAG: hypothetical protein QOD69_1478 [Solirubrobacteraceae bacterium]|jgi:hypothetical protein|nr:hypothetical protein [Solirubrobacteraceae bacterium]